MGMWLAAELELGVDNAALMAAAAINAVIAWRGHVQPGSPETRRAWSLKDQLSSVVRGLS